MATNQIYDSDQTKQLALPVPTGVVSGDPVLIGEALVGVALIDRDADGEATVALGGAFDLEVVAAGAMAVGDIVYIDDATNRELSDTNTGVRFGTLLEPIAGASTVTVTVKVGY
jgi:predicted RecA/RadA family phage recombinase